MEEKASNGTRLASREIFDDTILIAGARIFQGNQFSFCLLIERFKIHSIMYDSRSVRRKAIDVHKDVSFLNLSFWLLRVFKRTTIEVPKMISYGRYCTSNFLFAAERPPLIFLGRWWLRCKFVLIGHRNKNPGTADHFCIPERLVRRPSN